ncbi:CASP-like protein 4D, partial [Parasponia andersonii]
YVFSTIVIGTAYAILQLPLTIYSVVSNGEGIPLFDFYGDKVINLVTFGQIMSYLLATGAGAGFGITKDTKSLFEMLNTDLGNFYDKSNAATCLLFLAFICPAMLSMFSVGSVPKSYTTWTIKRQNKSQTGPTV